MRKPGDWYVSPNGRSIAGDGLLRGEYGNGKTPKEAVEKDYSLIVENLPSDRYIYTKNKYYRFESYQWREYSENYVSITRDDCLKKTYGGVKKA